MSELSESANEVDEAVSQNKQEASSTQVKEMSRVLDQFGAGIAIPPPLTHVLEKGTESDRQVQEGRGGSDRSQVCITDPPTAECKAGRLRSDSVGSDRVI